jgi:hypothetical protein
MRLGVRKTRRWRLLFTVAAWGEPKEQHCGLTRRENNVAPVVESMIAYHGR